MNVIKLVILWLSANEYLAQIVKQPFKSDDLLASLAEAAVDIVSKCYEKRVNTVGLAGISEIFLLETLSSQQTLAVTLIGNDTKARSVDRESPHKLQLFVVIASSTKHLEKILRQIKRSVWWNHMATFFILGSQSVIMELGCLKAFDFLWMAWKMDLLKATYLCVHRTRGRLVYSYNPYTSKAPEPWQLGNIYKGKNEHPWYLFLREYDGDELICENLEFDKTNDLAGYKINVTVKELPPTLFLDSNKTGINSITGGFGNLGKAIFHALNATAHLKIHDHKQRSGVIDTKGNDIAMDTVNGISDVLIIPRLHSGVENFTVSNAFYESGLIIVTQYSGLQSQLEKLLTVLDRSTRIGLCMVTLTIVIFFKFFRQQSLGSSILNTLRIIANSSLTKVPKNQGARIYLVGVFFIVVTIVGIYQGMLASLLTKSKQLPNVETLNDLLECGYTIHVQKLYARSFTALGLKNRIITHEEHNCSRHVLFDSSKACLGPQLLVFNDALDVKLHISREIIFKTSVVYVIRKNWPLEERLNKVLGALTAAYIPRYEFEHEIQTISKVERYNENLEKNRKFKVMTLRELTFAFVLLGIGLGCAALCFIVEVAVGPPRLRARNVGNLHTGRNPCVLRFNRYIGFEGIRFQRSPTHRHY